MNLETFVKCASEYTDTNGLPQHVLKAAHNIYTSNPELNANVVLAAYDSTDDIDAKLAFEVIGAVLVKQANPLALVGGALRAGTKQVALHAGLAGVGVASNAAQKKNTLQQGLQAVQVN